jgi:ABC-type lipoprotein release transport system permease subunit
VAVAGATVVLSLTALAVPVARAGSVDPARLLRSE